ncbi:hypothetical protein M199_gp063 [Halogranum tailed virus 1]|uniref:Uncharacterized protein n=1 Tax=Halogranum tailed virus 1 TaxID=1273749 RepID=R4TN22_9CAUD|nr:hypothetical protein M199_gp063 [Halogranum tailed virus 1]AGM11603.1 hypothetical protein HGTV1_306 [Halogranum tailed virus 1]
MARQKAINSEQGKWKVIAHTSTPFGVEERVLERHESKREAEAAKRRLESPALNRRLGVVR